MPTTDRLYRGDGWTPLDAQPTEVVEPADEAGNPGVAVWFDAGDDGPARCVYLTLDAARELAAKLLEAADSFDDEDD